MINDDKLPIHAAAGAPVRWTVTGVPRQRVSDSHAPAECARQSLHSRRTGNTRRLDQRHGQTAASCTRSAAAPWITRVSNPSWPPGQLTGCGGEQWTRSHSAFHADPPRCTHTPCTAYRASTAPQGAPTYKIEKIVIVCFFRLLPPQTNIHFFSDWKPVEVSICSRSLLPETPSKLSPHRFQSLSEYWPEPIPLLYITITFFYCIMFTVSLKMVHRSQSVSCRIIVLRQLEFQLDIYVTDVIWIDYAFACGFHYYIWNDPIQKSPVSSLTCLTSSAFFH